ncbi:hypothetical protein B296_00010985 [Ensete ventricosum]|uniref:Uncharacterized protein n=1 Tax=Ensete ventricosum TaxID=4639 RepID=A0A426Z4P8_ENSVE|nr:hypothetical protein B296_00010985 [Ensete ventricosum]
MPRSVVVDDFGLALAKKLNPNSLGQRTRLKGLQSIVPHPSGASEGGQKGLAHQGIGHAIQGHLGPQGNDMLRQVKAFVVGLQRGGGGSLSSETEDRVHDVGLLPEVFPGVDRLLEFLRHWESAQRDSGHERKRGPTQSIPVRKDLHPGSGSPGRSLQRLSRMSSASSHSESHSIKISAHRSRVSSHPFGDSVSVVVVPSSGVSGNSRIADALVVMRSFFNVESTMITHRLVDVRKNYFIPLEYELHVPLPGERPYDTSPCGFNLSTDTLEAGLRFLLYPIIKACLEEWRIPPSQMAPNSWRYLVVFLWECYGSGIVATRQLFMACFKLSRGQARYYLTTRSEFHVSGVPSSNKGWKSCFFFISHRRGWSFLTEWTSRMVNSSIPALSIDETKLVEILQGILIFSRG